MNVKKYLTVLAGAVLLSACTNDEPVNGPDNEGGGQMGSLGTVTFKVDGLAAGSTEQTTKAGETIIASPKENEIQVLDILVFAFCETDNTVTAVDGATTNITDNSHWKLQEWHYYQSSEVTNATAPFYRPAPSTGAGAENKFHRFQLQGSGAYRVATISPAVGLATSDKRFLCFYMVANAAMDKTLFGNDNFLDGAIPKSLADITGSSLNLFPQGTTIECPLPMVGSLKPAEGANDYITAADATKAFTINAMLKRAVARFDIVNLTPYDFTLTKIETPKPVDGSVSFATLHPTGYATEKVTINLPTIDKVDADGNAYWTKYGTDAMAFNSAFYTTPSAATNTDATTEAQKMTLKVYGTNGNQAAEKEVDLITTPTVVPGYNIDPNTRYRLLISYHGGIQATMEVVEWADDLLNPELNAGEKPVLKVPANNITSETPDPVTGIRPYTG